MSATKPEIDPESTCAHCGRDMQTFDNVCSNGAYCIPISEAYNYPHLFPDAKAPAVDVERELYLALKAITKNVQPSNGKCECPMCQGFAAIKLYEQKGKL